jgi:hypothetical protein
MFTPEFGEEHPDYMRRLFSGAAEGQHLHSPQVSTVLDLGRVQECYYIMSEHFPGDLRSLLDDKAALPVRRVLGIAEDVLKGLKAVERAGQVHGGVTPGGVLIGYDGAAHLDHPGTALRQEDLHRLTVTPGGRLDGPALYFAPERRDAAEPGDIRSDLYSLGCVMYEALTGAPPYAGQSAEEVLEKHREGSPPRLHTRRPEVPEEISDFVARLMARNPDRRPQGPGQALEELRDMAVRLSEAGRIKPVKAARKPGLLPFDVRWTSIWTVVAVLLVAAIVVPFGLTCRVREKREEARRAAALAGRARTVVLLVRQKDPRQPDTLTAGRKRAVTGLLRYRLSFYPELRVADPGFVARLQEEGRTIQEIRRALNARNLVVAAHEPGFERRNWQLVFTSYRDEPWSEIMETSVEEGSEDLGSLEGAARELLRRSAARLELEVPNPGDEPLREAPAAAWARAYQGTQAERRDDWESALGHAEAAARESEGSPAFATLSAFYRAALNARRTGEFTPFEAPPEAALPPELSGLAAALRAVLSGDATAVAEALGRHLANYQNSVRGYYLLGLWRLHGLKRPGEAALAMRHAADLDPSYLPAVFGYLRLLAERDPDRLSEYVAAYAEDQPDEQKVNAVRELADELGAQLPAQ